MYKITEVKQVLTLPKHLNENEHISWYIMQSSKDINKESSIKKSFSIARTDNRAYTLFKINDTEVWCLQKEVEYWIDILPNIKENKVLAWYEVGSMTPLGGLSKSLIRVSAVDGYQLNFMYNI